MVCWTWLAAVRLRGDPVPLVHTTCASSERMGSMSFPQPPNDPQSQQPGYPPSTAPASSATSIDFAAVTAPENRAYLIAGVGGIVALISYFAFSYWGVSSGLISFSFTGSQLANSASLSGVSNNILLNLLWLVPLASLAAL